MEAGDGPDRGASALSAVLHALRGCTVTGGGQLSSSGWTVGGVALRSGSVCLGGAGDYPECRVRRQFGLRLGGNQVECAGEGGRRQSWSRRRAKEEEPWFGSCARRASPRFGPGAARPALAASVHPPPAALLVPATRTGPSHSRPYAHPGRASERERDTQRSRCRRAILVHCRFSHATLHCLSRHCFALPCLAFLFSICARRNARPAVPRTPVVAFEPASLWTATRHAAFCIPRRAPVLAVTGGGLLRASEVCPRRPPSIADDHDRASWPARARLLR